MGIDRAGAATANAMLEASGVTSRTVIRQKDPGAQLELRLKQAEIHDPKKGSNDKVWLRGYADLNATSADGLAWRLHGALFFGATDKLDVLLEAAQTVPVGSTMTLDMAALFALDTTGVDSLEQLLKALEQRGAHLALEGMQPQVQSLLERSGLTEKLNLAR